jgi:hypothetical protein
VDLRSNKVQFALNQYESVILCLDGAFKVVALISKFLVHCKLPGFEVENG